VPTLPSPSRRSVVPRRPLPAASAASFVALADHVDDVIARFDADLRFVYLNDACARLLGRGREEMLGRSIGDGGTPPETAKVMRDAVRRALAGEHVALGRIASFRPGRETWWFETRIIPEVAAGGTIDAVILCARDVTEQRTAEVALAESEDRFRAVFESAPMGMAFSTLEGHGYATNANSALARMLGYTGEELAQMHFTEFTHPDDVEPDLRLLQQVQEGRRDGYSLQKRFVRKDGSAFWGQVSISAVRDAAERLRYIVGITEDISERKEIEAELRGSEERFRALVDRSSDLIAILEPEGQFRYTSPAVERILYYSQDEIAGMNAFELVHPDDRPRVRARFAEVMRVAESIPSSRPIRFRRRDGSWCYLMTVTSDLRSNPAVRGIVVNVRDVTTELRLQEQLTQAQKMEALGQLAGGVAHDFNNILAAIAGYAELVAADVPAGSQLADDVREIARAAARGAGVTKQLLAFSRQQSLETELLDLRSVVGEIGRMLLALLPASIELTLPSMEGPGIRVNAARAQVEQILMNLAVNARDAMPAGGELRIDLSTRRGAAGEEAVIVVADSGGGMSEEVRSRAFEPFFTTKPKGQGTGLGLATVYGLVRQFGGRVELQSSRGAGTTFAIILPVAAQKGEADDDATARTPIVRHRARVLVAEDEAPLRTIVARALERVGCEVVTAADGAAALAAIHAGRAFDLLISDVAMPRLGGRELAMAVEAGWNTLPMILMSGYAELGSTPEAGRDFPANVVAFLEKPFEMERLVTIVSEALSGISRRA